MSYITLQGFFTLFDSKRLLKIHAESIIIPNLSGKRDTHDLQDEEVVLQTHQSQPCHALHCSDWTVTDKGEEIREDVERRVFPISQHRVFFFFFYSHANQKINMETASGALTQRVTGFMNHFPQ